MPSTSETGLLNQSLEYIGDPEELKNQYLSSVRQLSIAWSEKIQEIMARQHYTPQALATLCGVSRSGVVRWLEGSIPGRRDTFIRIGFAAEYDLSEMNKFLQRYGRYNQLYAKSLEDSVYIFVLNSETLPHTYATCQELLERQALLRRLEADILRMEGTSNMEKTYQVIVMEDPEQKVFSIRRTTGVEGYHQLFEDLRREAAARGLTQAGPIQMLYHDQDFHPERSDVEAQMVVAQDGPDVKVKPACLCAAVRHRGPYENLHLAYDALCAWLAEHPEYRVCGPAMDRYLNDPHSTPPDSLETGVLFPVQRR